MKPGHRIEYLDTAKGIAICSVISAHCNLVPDGSPRITIMQSALLNNLSRTGVILLFIISGYLYHVRNAGSGYVFRKIRSLIWPWIISGIIVYLYVHLRKPPLTFAGLLNFLLGVGSYLYYLTVLCAFYLIFYVSVMRKRAVLLICIIVGYAHTILIPNGLGNFINPYLNILNWIQYFAIGVFLHENKMMETVKFRSLLRILFPLLYFVIIVIFSIDGLRIEYWSGWNPIISTIGAIAIFIMATYISNISYSDVLKSIGKSTLFIYLWHMPIAGIVTKLFGKKALLQFVLIRPIVVLLVVYLAMNLLDNILENRISIKRIIGLR